MSWWKPKKGKELKPRHSVWKIGLNARKPFKDSDKDKVVDIFDCQPHNRRKQGPEHDKPEAYLEDDGSLDTVISVHGKKGSKEFRFNPEGRRNIKRLKEEAIEAYEEED